MDSMELLPTAKERQCTTVKEWFIDESRWTQGTYGKNQYGLPINDSNDCYCFCLVGAIEHIYQDDVEKRHKIYYRIFTKLFPKSYSLDYPYVSRIFLWNDEEGRTFEEIKQLVSELNI